MQDTTGLKIVLSEIIIIAAAILFKQSHPFFLFVCKITVTLQPLIHIDSERFQNLFVSPLTNA